MWEWVKPLAAVPVPVYKIQDNLHTSAAIILIIYHTALYKKAYENMVGSGENAGDQHFSLFATLFSTLSKTNVMHLQMFSIWTSLKVCCLVDWQTFNNLVYEGS